MNQLPDVEVIFEFNGTRKSPANDGYRPAHLITDNYLTTGIHHYYGVESVPPNGTVKGTITFLSPESYPHCLWIGKKISIQEGAHVVGYATITNIITHCCAWRINNEAYQQASSFGGKRQAVGILLTEKVSGIFLTSAVVSQRRCLLVDSILFSK